MRTIGWTAEPGEAARHDAPSKLQDFIDRHQRLFVLTGAGCSTNSGIPDYRDADGNWKRVQPMTYQAFMGDQAARRRYWARSMIGLATLRPRRSRATSIARSLVWRRRTAS